MADEKPFKPSKKKLDKARKDGQVLKSPLVTQFFVVISCLCLSYLIALFGWERNKMLLEYTLVNGFTEPVEVLRDWLLVLAVFLAVVVGIPALIAILVEMAQVGLKFEASILKPKAERFSIASGTKKIFSGLKQIPELLIRVVVFCGIYFTFFVGRLENLPGKFSLDASYQLAFCVHLLFELIAVGLAVFLFFSFVEYTFKKKKFFKQLSMDFEELKRENKESEGDPMVKHQRKAEHQALLTQSMVKRMRKAKVLIVEKNA